jgi:hypothetical protein
LVVSWTPWTISFASGRHGVGGWSRLVARETTLPSKTRRIAAAVRLQVLAPMALIGDLLSLTAY